MGREYHNCLRTYLPSAVEGISSFAEVQRGNTGAIVHLHRAAMGWRLRRIYAKENGEPPAALEAFTRRHLATFNITLLWAMVEDEYA